jgi:hypothetical protein
MTFEEAVAQQPAWVGYWLYWLVFGTLVLPLALLIWKQTRLVGVITFVGSLIAGFAVNWMFGQMGYVKLLGLPHIIILTPIVIYQILQFQRLALPPVPKWILGLVIATILISLAFDYTDALRFLLGERAPLAAKA